jgi:hypothetical protein
MMARAGRSNLNVALMLVGVAAALYLVSVIIVLAKG